jgi:Hypoxia induced protein conserved region
MTSVFILLAGLLAFGAAVSLVRGLVAFLQAAEIDLKNPSVGVSASSLQQNRMMRNRLLYQGGAVFAVVILLSMAGN